MTTQTPGDWLRGQLTHRETTPAQLARQLEVSETLVYGWIRGRGKPGDHNARKIAELIGVPEVELRRRFGLYIHSVEGLTEEQAQLILAAIRRRIALLEETAKTERERDVLEQLREVVDSPDEVDEPG